MKDRRDDKVERRNRPPKSCDPCRLRKLKCNRDLPCDTCVRRGKSCQYAANADRTPTGTWEPQRETVSQRLRNLESLVVSLAQESAPSDEFLSPSHAQPRPSYLPTPGSDGDGSLRATAAAAEPGTTATKLPQREGVPSSSDDGVTRGTERQFYVDASHWSCLLEDIRQIRNELSPSSTPTQHQEIDWSSPEQTSYTSIQASSKNGSHVGDDLMFGPFGPLDLGQIIVQLPPRQVCDRLVSQYFRTRHAILPILHPVKFQREYASFWDAKESAPPLWVGLLFAVLSLSAGMAELSDTGSGTDQSAPSAKVLSRCTEQCLVLGRYASAQEYSLEVLLIHLQSCYLGSKDSDLNLWFLMGIIIRLALKLGYHRDPTKLPTARLSPFDGEMRRRVWVTIFQIDTLMSFQMGLPSMIATEYCDTELPRNLENSDFEPETLVLPQPRPISDYTPVLYTLAKSSILSMFRTVIRHTRSLTPCPYDETMALDVQLRSTYNNVPAALIYRPIGQSIVDGPGIIMDRITIEMLHLKSMMVLHRQYITTHRPNPLFNASRRACMQAAQTALFRQIELHEATQPGCQLYDQRWMLTALTMSDFILAAMLICLELTMRCRRPSTFLRASSAGDTADHDVLYSSLHLLQRCQGIWEAAARFSTEARMASDAIASTIRRTRAWQEEERPHIQEPFRAEKSTREDGTMEQDPSTAMQNHIEEAYDEAAYIDWGMLDNQFHEPWDEGIDFDSWIMEAVESSGARPMDLV